MSESPAATPCDRRFVLWLVAIAAAGLAWRVIYIVAWRRNMVVWGDAYFYHHSANLIADGKGWIYPLQYLQNGVVTQAADHPPLYLLYLAFWSKLGLTSPLSHLLTSSLVGAATVFVAGLAGRQIAGRRVGIVAAVLAATYPNLWNWDGLLLSETMAIFTVTLTLWLAYRFWRRPTLLGAILLGAAVAAAALSRAELLLLSVLLITPLVLTVRAKPWRIRIGWLAASAATCVAVLAPWVGYNLSRFDRPVYLSNGFEITLATSSCDYTFYGPTTGYWSIWCPVDYLAANGIDEATTDQSLRSDVLRRESLDYLRNHERRIPAVVLARWGRITGLWDPIQQADLDTANDRMTPWVPQLGTLWWYPMVALAVGGAVSLHRRRVPVYPLLAPLVTVAIVVTILFAQTRYRASAEPAIVLLAAVGVDALWRGYRRVRDDPEDQPQRNTSEPSASVSTTTVSPST